MATKPSDNKKPQPIFEKRGHAHDGAIRQTPVKSNHIESSRDNTVRNSSSPPVNPSGGGKKGK